MLQECDLDGSGDCQFPEFLLLIKVMQDRNFCGKDSGVEKTYSSSRSCRIATFAVGSREDDLQLILL